MHMADVTTDDIRLALVPVSKKSSSMYQSVLTLYKSIFNAAVDSNIIEKSPCERISAKGGKPQQDKEALTDDQAEKLLDAIKGLPPYVFVMMALRRTAEGGDPRPQVGLRLSGSKDSLSVRSQGMAH